MTNDLNYLDPLFLTFTADTSKNFPNDEANVIHLA